MSFIPGYSRLTHLGVLYSKVYEEYKDLCLHGKQSIGLTEYCESYGISWIKMDKYLRRNKLTVVKLPGYTSPRRRRRIKKYKEIPLEDVIFEEAGFLPAESINVITVRVDGHVEVSFPADTDLSVIMKFVHKMRKEAGHAGLDSCLHLWVCQNPVSMRYGIRGLTQLIWSWKGHSPASGDVYVFFFTCPQDYESIKMRW